MPDLIPLGFGLFVVAVGLVTAAIEWRARRAEPGPAETDEDAAFLAKRGRRRTQVSVMLMLIGVAIPLGDKLFEAGDRPLLFAFYWLGVLLLVGWVVLIGLLDLAATRIHTRIQLRRLDRRKNEIVDQLSSLRHEAGPDA